MAIDPNIPLMAGQGVTPLLNPLEARAKVNAYEIGKMAFEDAKAKRQQQQDARAIFQEAGGDFRKAQGIAQDRGLLDHVDYFGEIADKHDTQLAQLREASSKMDEQQRKEMLDRIQTLGKAADFVRSQPSERQQQAQDLVASQLGLKELAGKPVDLGQLDMFSSQMKNFGKALEPDKPMTDIGKLNWELQKGLITQAQFDAALRKATHIAPSGGSRSPDYVGNPSGQAVTLDQVPPNLRDMVKAIGEYRMLPTNLGNRDRSIVMSYVAKAYPNFSQGDAQANAKFMNELASQRPGTAGGIVLSTERMVGHANELLDLTNKLGNSDSLLGHGLDVVEGVVKKAMSPTAAAWEFTHGKLMAEAQKLVTGGVPGSQELLHDIKNSKFTDPISKQRGLIRAIVDVGLQNTEGIRQQRDNLLGVNSPGDSMLSQQALDKIQKIYEATGGEAPDLGTPANGRGYSRTAQKNNPTQQVGPAPASVLSGAPPAIVNAYYAGKTIQGPDGKSYRKGN